MGRIAATAQIPVQSGAARRTRPQLPEPELAPLANLDWRRHGARIYVDEFSAIAWAQGAENYLRDCIALFEEFGWDWTYHAFREWNGWSVEHEGPDARHMVPSADNPRRRALLDSLRGIVPPSPSL